MKFSLEFKGLVDDLEHIATARIGYVVDATQKRIGYRIYILITTLCGGIFAILAVAMLVATVSMNITEPLAFVALATLGSTSLILLFSALLAWIIIRKQEDKNRFKARNRSRFAVTSEEQEERLAEQRVISRIQRLSHFANPNRLVKKLLPFGASAATIFTFLRLLSRSRTQNVARQHARRSSNPGLHFLKNKSQEIVLEIVGSVIVPLLISKLISEAKRPQKTTPAEHELPLPIHLH